jgi:hypothetical protein
MGVSCASGYESCRNPPRGPHATESKRSPATNRIETTQLPDAAASGGGWHGDSVAKATATGSFDACLAEPEEK